MSLRLPAFTKAPVLVQVRPTHAGWGLVHTRPAAKDRKKWVAGTMVKGRNEPASLIQILEIVAGEVSLMILLPFLGASTIVQTCGMPMVACTAFRKVFLLCRCRSFIPWGCLVCLHPG